jgi:hypothetical protein
MGEWTTPVTGVLEAYILVSFLFFVSFMLMIHRHGCCVSNMNNNNTISSILPRRDFFDHAKKAVKILTNIFLSCLLVDNSISSASSTVQPIVDRGLEMNRCEHVATHQSGFNIALHHISILMTRTTMLILLLLAMVMVMMSSVYRGFRD